MNVSNHKHVKSFEQFIAEEYNATLRSDPEITIHMDPDYKEPKEDTNKTGADEEVEENVLDREYDEPSYLDKYKDDAPISNSQASRS